MKKGLIPGHSDLSGQSSPSAVQLPRIDQFDLAAFEVTGISCRDGSIKVRCDCRYHEIHGITMQSLLLTACCDTSVCFGGMFVKWQDAPVKTITDENREPLLKAFPALAIWQPRETAVNLGKRDCRHC